MRVCGCTRVLESERDRDRSHIWASCLPDTFTRRATIFIRDHLEGTPVDESVCENVRVRVRIQECVRICVSESERDREREERVVCYACT